MATMAAQEAQEPTSRGEGGVAPKRRVNYLQRSLVLSLHHLEPDRSHKALAEAVGISESSVTRILRMHQTDVRQSTEALMQSAVLDQLENWHRAASVAAKKGYHQPAKDWLEAAKAVEPKAPVQTSVNVAPTVVLQMPFGLGALADYRPPAIEAQAQPVPALPAKEEA
jgi:hypothetical protein